MFDIVRGWRIAGSPEAIRNFREMLSGWAVDADGQLRLLRLELNPRNQNLAKWPIAGSTAEREFLDEGDPLVWGFLEGRRRITGTASEVWELTARLTLNPTKWISQQSVRLTQSPDEEWLATPSIMFARAEPFSLHEIPLVRSANVFIGLPRDLHLMKPAMWGTQIQRYVRDTVGLLNQSLSTAAELSGVQLTQDAHDFRLKELEIYWEFWSERPLEEMIRIERGMRQAAASSTTSWWPLDPASRTRLASGGAIEVGVNDNSPRVSMRLAEGIVLRVYAKTNKRLRFEVAYKPSSARTDFYTTQFNSPSSLADALVTARTPAAHRLQQVLGAIRMLANVVSEQKAPHELISDIYAAVPNVEHAQTLVSTLISCGRVAAYPKGSMRDHLVRLRQCGIMRSFSRAGNDFVWTVTPRYRYALAILRGVESTQDSQSRGS